MSIGHTAAATLSQLQAKIDTISNNMANAETTGFKRRSASFADVLTSEYLNQPNENRQTPHGLRVGTGAKLAQTQIQLEQGTLRETGRALDFALTEADLFYNIETVSGTRLTRDGTFYFSPQAVGNGLELVTNDGNRVLDSNGEAIVMPGDTVALEWRDGNLFAQLGNGGEQQVGSFALTRVLRPQTLESAGNNVYVLPELPGVSEEVEATDGHMKQNMLEQANVDLGVEMAELMETQRLLQFQARAYSFADDMAGLANNIRR
ncbi:flagellar hook-basal body protein [Shouchella clausii]|uniref:flagellar hook-basal body protein n=1 Tax=Shouchella TaxID=2893057 RepID=UPI000786D94B|nr:MULTISPECIES: flagellar hook-basal body protein [Shouchella]PAD44142.1 flagellar hook-basal body protein [Bacillus sp. 7520-S]MBU8595728.1 flagellar hook-basal body protein [Shouchella clausii]PAD10081.1 flagellar hook-basal body protein [Shouchella clausii]PAE85833.1 flagellar hook-basal body protein [Shouchella clausii]PAE98330.1 flagellar hook-basal body protein [Shouchella clausii]